jgi:mannose-6-phosphate isomerase-like protein (cupin superfamily)
LECKSRSFLRTSPNTPSTASEDGQEEVYVVLSGSAEIEIEGERIPLDPETIVRVGPGVSRRIVSGPQGARILALGGVPGAVYEPPEFTKIET